MIFASIQPEFVILHSEEISKKSVHPMIQEVVTVEVILLFVYFSLYFISAYADLNVFIINLCTLISYRV